MRRLPTVSFVVALVSAALLASTAAAFPAGRTWTVTRPSGPATDNMASEATTPGVTAKGSVSAADQGLTDFLVVATVPVGSSPFGVGYNSGNGYVYVANEGSGTVTVIDGTTVVATIPVGSHPRDAGYNSGNGHVYVTNYASNNVTVLDGTTVVANISVGMGPEGVAYDPGNGYVYVVNRASGTVSVLDGTTVVANVSVGLHPEELVYNSENGHMYVANQGSDNVSVIDGTTVVATVPVGPHAEGVGYDPGNGYVYVANWASNTVTVIRGTTVVANVTVGTGPEAIGYDSGDGYIFVSNYDSNNMSVIDGTTVVATFPVGVAPEGVEYDSGDGYLYVANGGSNTVTVIYTPPKPSQQFLVTFSATGLPTGTSWSVTLAGSPRSSTTSTIGFSETNGTYSYTVSAVSGYTANPASGSVTVSGADVVQTIAFTSTTPATYAVTFTESGLPSGTSWSVVLAGNPQSSTTNTIAFSEPNGTYAYTVGGVTGYTSSPSSGSVSVAGAAQSVSITFTSLPPDQYTVTFTESGLPSGTSWSVTLGGTTLSSNTISIVFTEANGTYSYTVGSVAGYTATSAAGTVTVAGAAQSVSITFTLIPPAGYLVAFTQTGLLGGTSWSVTLAGSTRSSTTGLIVFTEANGTYSYTVGDVAGYVPNPVSGTVTVAGAAQSVSITFIAIPPGQYAVTFTESGLPSGTSWSVTLGGTTLSSNTISIVFTEANGTYSYTVGDVNRYTFSPTSGTVTVAGAAQSVSITFIAIPPGQYAVTFTESGLPSGTSWSVTLGGTTLSSNTISIVFTEANGTYSFAVGSVPGYTSPLTSGSIAVNGAPWKITVAFTAISPTSLGPAFPEWYVWLAVTAIGVVAVAIVFVLARRRRKRGVTPGPP